MSKSVMLGPIEKMTSPKKMTSTVTYQIQL